ncbi:uncharacterized protein BDV14DRAFT_26098 [Aspergillus stella-maris]|uniref:uncharacterized protein n=1 Tax=Aspergillus stella-maris TaxID=1810926 RepID=UPI003CCCFE3B
MASGLFTLSRTSAMVGLGLGVGATFSLLPTSPFRASPMRCDYAAGATGSSWTTTSNPPLGKSLQTRDSGIMTASNMRQVSMGSVLGLVVGVGLRAFSRVLVVLLGLGFVAVEWAASKGYNVLPVHRLQKYVKSFDLDKAMSENRPFKITFAATMALAAFAQF